MGWQLTAIQCDILISSSNISQCHWWPKRSSLLALFSNQSFAHRVHISEMGSLQYQLGSTWGLFYNIKSLSRHFKGYPFKSQLGEDEKFQHHTITIPVQSLHSQVYSCLPVPAPSNLLQTTEEDLWENRQVLKSIISKVIYTECTKH